jgi:hypothetical protein
MKDTLKSPKRTARLAGFLYLIVIICAGFSEGYVRSSLVVPGDATATAANITAAEWLFRLGFASDLVAFMADAAIAMLLYVLLRPVNKPLSLMAASFRLLAHPAIGSINLLNHFGVLLLLDGSDSLTVFETDQLHALASLLLGAHGIGYLIGGAFFGVHLLFLGYLLHKSDYFPPVLGVLLLVAALGYLTESFGNFLFPEYAEIYVWGVAVPAVVGEVSLCVWLLSKGVLRPTAVDTPA